MKRVPRRFRTHYYRDRAARRERTVKWHLLFEQMLNPVLTVPEYGSGSR